MSSHFFPTSATPKCSNYAIRKKLLLWISFSFEIGIWKVVEKGDTIENLRNMGLTLKYLFKQKLSLIAMSISQHACIKINIEIQNLIFERKPTDYLIQLPTQYRKFSHYNSVSRSPIFTNIKCVAQNSLPCNSCRRALLVTFSLKFCPSY